MLSDSKIIALYCIVDDMLKAMHHYEDARVRVSDSEVITTAFVAVLYFGGHLDNARHFMQMQGYVPGMLDKSRFCRRLHRLADLLLALFYTLGKQLKDMAGAATYRWTHFRWRCATTSASAAAEYCREKSIGESTLPCAAFSMKCGYRC